MPLRVSKFADLAGATRAILFGGLVVTAAATAWVHHAVEEQANATFERLALPVEREVLQRFNITAYGINGAAAAISAARQSGLAISRGQFRAFVEARQVEREFPGVRGFGFIQRVVRENTERFVAAERADGAPDFAVRQIDDRGHPDLYVIKHIEPVAQNRPAVGLDVGSEPRRRAAIERAIDEARITITAPLVLVQDGRKTPGFLVFRPIYHTRTAEAVAELRRPSLVGVAYAPVVARELLAGVVDAKADLLDFELFWGHGAAAHDPDHVVYDNDGHLSESRHATAALRQRIDRKFVALREVTIHDQPFTIAISGTERFEAGLNSAEPWVAAIGGLLLTLLLALAAEQAATGRRRAEVLAAQMTRDRDRLAMVAERTSNAVIITDRALRIEWVNEAFTRLYGYRLEDAIGRTLGDLIGGPNTAPETLATLRAVAEAGTGCRVEVVNRTADGRDVWVDTEVQPRFDADGVVCGFIEIASDITARRAAEARMASLMRENHALLGTIREHAIVSMADAQGRIVEVNDAFCQISGYAREELLGQDHRIVNSGVQPKAFWTAMWGTISAGRPWRGQVCNRAKDGSLYWVDSIVAPFAGADGRIEKYVSIRHDITERKNAERELSRQRNRLGQIIEGTSVGTWEWNVETGETVFNERWAEIVGYTLAELGPTSITTWTSLVHPEDGSRSAELLERHFNGQTPAYECEARMRHKDGHWVWVLDRGKLFTRSADGRPVWMAGTHMDITERKAAEAALRASQEFLDRTGRIAGVGGWELDLSTRSLRWTDQTCRLHGVQPGHPVTVDEAVGFYPDDARAAIEQAMETAIATGQGYDLELPLVTARGDEIWIRTVGEVQYEDGRAVRLVGAIQDITARRGLEDELRRNNQRMATVVENLPCGLSVFDGDLRLVASNRQYAELLDFPPALFAPEFPAFESFIRHNAERGEYGAGDPEAIVRQAVARACAPAVPHRFERTRPDGTVLEVRGGPMPGGGFVTTYTDVTEQRLAEQALAQRERMMRLVIDCFPGPLAHWDTQERCTIANRAYVEWMGLEPEEMVGRTQLELIGAELYARNRELIAGALAGLVQTVERSRVRADGSTVEYMLGYYPDRDGDTVRGFVSTVIDITELKRVQRHLEERTAQAEEASVAKSRFLANMSHEIRTPMNAILGMLSLLRRTPLSPRQGDYAAKTEGAARSLLGLLNDILDFSKVEANKLTLDPQPLEIQRLLGDLSVIFAANVGAKPVEMLFDIAPEVPRSLIVDGLRLQQVLINLVGNAIKFTEQGEVVLSMRSLGREGDRVRLGFAVRDTGIGIAPENHERIFSGFTQAEASTTRRFGGTGLGVAISQRIVGLMGGTLALKSAPGEGSCFSFEIELPVAPEPDAVVASGPRRVLVVDDHPIAREVLARAAASLGWDVSVAVDGASAIRTVEAAEASGHPFDAAFVDWAMPGMDGWETVRALRAAVRERHRLALVMVTAHGREDLQQRSERDRSMIDGFIVKPVTPAMLAEALSHPEEAGVVDAPSQTPLAGLRLLVAEDNPNNQQVARELLEAEGATVTIVPDGAQAVACAAVEPLRYDLVLMDLQMPVMDGLEAAARIRALPQGADLPIVAMTANAMASDREACLAAGMNHHVGKPFDLANLIAVILDCVGRVQRAPATPAPTTASGPRATAVAAAGGVGLDSAVGRMGGRTDVYLRMLRGFLPDLEVLLRELRAEAAAGRAEDVRRRLHTAKGVAATLGLRALAEALAGAEAQAREACTPDALLATGDALAGPVDAACRLLPSLVAALEQDAAAVAPPVASGPAIDLRAALERLVALLRDSDLAATDVLAGIAAGCPGERPDWLPDLEQAVNNMEFDAALEQARAALAALETVAA